MKFSLGSMIGTVISLALIIFGVIETIKVTEYTKNIGNQFFLDCFSGGLDHDLEQAFPL